MALITTTGSFIRQYNAFTGLSALERAQSGVARAEIVYYNVNDTWAAPGAGNNRLYQTGQIELPKDFGYALTDAFVTVEKSATGTTVNTEQTGDFRIFVGGALGPQIRPQLVAASSEMSDTPGTAIGDIPASQYTSTYPSISGDRASKSYVLDTKPTAILYPFGSNTYSSTPNPATIWELAIGEAAANGAEYRVTSYIRFLQYDIDQSYNYVVQSPQLTR